jgi:hypothetical protein
MEERGSGIRPKPQHHSSNPMDRRSRRKTRTKRAATAAAFKEVRALLPVTTMQ